MNLTPLTLSNLGQIRRFYQPHEGITSNEYKRLAELHSMATAILDDFKLGQKRIYDLLPKTQITQLVEFQNKNLRSHFADGEKGQGVCDDIERILAILDEKLNLPEDHIEHDSVSYRAEVERKRHAFKIASKDTIEQCLNQLITEKSTTGSIASLEDKIDNLFEEMFTSPLDYVSCKGLDNLVKSLDQQELEKILDRLYSRCERIKFVGSLFIELLTTAFRYHNNPSFQIGLLEKIFRAAYKPGIGKDNGQRKRLFDCFQRNFKGNEEAKRTVKSLFDDGYLMYAVSKRVVDNFLSS